VRIGGTRIQAAVLEHDESLFVELMLFFVRHG
jgi:hypothetical protein